MINIYLLYGALLGGYFSMWQPSLMERGMSAGNIPLIIAIQTLLMLVLGVPTGVLADRSGAKKTVVLGLLVLAVSFAVPSINSSIGALVFAVIFYSVSYSLIDGALELWANRVDNSGKESNKADNHKFFRRDQLTRIGLIVGALSIGGIAARHGLGGKVHWLVICALSCLTLAVALMIQDYPDHHTPKARVPMFDIGTLKLVPAPVMLGILFFGMSDGATDSALYPRMHDMGFASAAAFGALQASFSISRVLGLQLWGRFRAVAVGAAWIPGVAMLGSACLGMLFALLPPLPFVGAGVWLLKIACLSAYFSTITTHTIKSISSPARIATALSLNSTIYLLGKLILSSFVGLSAFRSSPAMICGLGAIASMVSAGFLFSINGSILRIANNK